MTNKYVNILYRNWNLGKECINDTIGNIVKSQINKNGLIYLPFILTLFMFILINNLIGMIPYSFSTTSHFVLTFSISFSVVIGATILGFKEHNLKFFWVICSSRLSITFITYISNNRIYILFS